MVPQIDINLAAAIVAAPFVGSFAATLGLRLCTGQDALFGRSACDRCGTRLGASDLVPILSFARSGGRCRACGGVIDPLHPAAELAAIAVPLAAAAVATGLEFWFLCTLGWLLIAQVVADLRHFLLPDSLNLAILGLGLAATWWLAPASLADALIGAAAGFVALAIVAVVYRRLRGRDGLGLGDAKLLGALGAWTGWYGLPSTVLIAALSATVMALALGLLGRRMTATTAIPFGPHLVLGGWIVVLCGPLAIG
jgi:leader peptidase (prepilin peptidase)/N-methyltransferase